MKQDICQVKQWALISLLILIIAIVIYLFGAGMKTTANKSFMATALVQHQESKGVLPHHVWTTKNGAKVYFISAPALPMVDIKIAFDAGAARDGDKHGLAYLTNALLEDGTSSLNVDQVAQNFEQVGAEFSWSVDLDMAEVHLRTLRQDRYFMPAIQTLSDVLTHPAFGADGLTREQKKVLIALQDEKQNPARLAQKAFYQKVFLGQPYANWIYGDKQSVPMLTQADLKEFYNKYYVAKNAVVAIVGALQVEEAAQIAETIMQDLPSGDRAENLPPVADLEKSTEIKIAFPSEQTHIVLGALGMKQGDADYFPLYLGNHIFGGNVMVSRLFQLIRNEQGLAYDVHSYFIPMRERGPFLLGLQTRNEKATEALELLKTQLVDFIEKGPTNDELTAAKKNILGGFALRFDSNTALCRNLLMLGMYDLPLDFYDKYTAAIENVTNQDIQEAFKRRIHADTMVTVMVGGGFDN